MTTSDLKLVFDIFGSLSFLIGAIYGVKQLRALAGQGKFAAMRGFQDILAEHADLFIRVLDDFPLHPENETIANLSPNLLSDASHAVDAQNIIGQMIEEGVVDTRLYFSLTHVQVIRLAYVLKPYTDWMTMRQGAPYGRRIHRIADRAVRYHELSPSNRQTPILLIRDGEPVTILPGRVDDGWFSAAITTARFKWKRRWRNF